MSQGRGSDAGSGSDQSQLDELTICFTLFRADTELRRRFDAVLSDVHGLSVTDFAVLLNLADAPQQQLRRVDLASRLGLTASAVTRLLIPLEKVGLVSRRSNPGDARVALAVLTPAGRERITEARASAQQRAAELLRVHFTPEEIDTLGQLLERLVPASNR